ncbi:potassium channel family protein [Nonomuraea polychroma]|uniref:potassium channel family protein n=1 Tax=Nonomuraea polychroma TaxID=46176 RepID=UPI003D8D902A
MRPRRTRRNVANAQARDLLAEPRSVVAIGTALEASILTASLLVELDIQHIWAKAITRHHGQILQRIGVHHVVFPEHEIGERLARLVSGRMLDFMQVDENFALVKTRPPKECVGMPLGRSNVRRTHGVTIVAVKSPGEEFTNATAETELTYDDINGAFFWPPPLPANGA